MRAVQIQPREGIRRQLSEDHERLEAVFRDLIDEYGEGDWAAVRRGWTRFHEGLEAHLSAEEHNILPTFAAAEPATAASLLREHALFRRTLDELGVGVDLHVVNLNIAQAFVDALRAHARREDRSLYLWAAQELSSAGQAAVREELRPR